MKKILERIKHLWTGKKSEIFWVFFYITAFMFLFMRSATTLDPDFGWHLRVGEDILKEQAVPQYETYLYTTFGREWTDHEWLGNVLFYEIFTAGKYGYLALASLFALATLACFVLLTWVARKYYLPDIDSSAFIFFAALVQSLGLLIFDNFQGVRLQVFSWLFLAILILLFLQFIEIRRTTRLLWLIPLFLLWSNLHGSFVLGVAVSAIFFAYCIIFLKAGKIDFILLWLAALAVTFINPYGLEIWKMILVDYTSGSYYLKHIMEWLPQYYFPFIWSWMIYAALYVFLLIFILAPRDSRRSFNKTNYFMLLLSLIFFALSVEYRRHSPIFFLFSYPIILVMLNKTLSNFKLKANTYVIFVLACVFFSINITFAAKVASYANGNPFDLQRTYYPVKALEFIKNNEEYAGLKMLNHYGWGGYLEWMWPEKKIFIDGRYPQMKISGEKTFLEEYSEFNQKGMAGDKLKEHGIQLVLWQRTEEARLFWADRIMQKFMKIDGRQKEKDLLPYLSENWEKVYEDALSVVYVDPLAAKNRL